MTLIIDMFSGTGELGRAVAAGLAEPTQILSLSDSYGPARKYLEHRFPGMEVHKDFRDQDVPQGSIVTIGALPGPLRRGQACRGRARLWNAEQPYS